MLRKRYFLRFATRVRTPTDQIVKNRCFNVFIFSKTDLSTSNFFFFPELSELSKLIYSICELDNASKLLKFVTYTNYNSIKAELSFISHKFSNELFQYMCTHLRFLNVDKRERSLILWHLNKYNISVVSFINGAIYSNCF